MRYGMHEVSQPGFVLWAIGCYNERAILNAKEQRASATTADTRAQIGCSHVL